MKFCFFFYVVVFDTMQSCGWELKDQHCGNAMLGFNYENDKYIIQFKLKSET